MCVGGVVVADHVQLHPRVGLGDLFEEAQELLMAMPGQTHLLDPPGRAHLLDPPGRDLQRGEQGGGAVANVVVGLALRDCPGTAV